MMRLAAWAAALLTALSVASARAAPTKPSAASASARRPAANGTAAVPSAARLPSWAGEAVSLEVAPAAVTLRGPRSSQHLVVIAATRDGATYDATDFATISLADPKVARVRDGMLLPASDGVTRLTARLGRLSSAATPVTVQGASQPAQVEFVNDIMPILAKAGCNSTACHGSPVGKGGLKLSLFGYEPDLDFAALTAAPAKEGEPRRADPKQPERSLVLQKATGAVSHGGGMRIKPDSHDAQTILAWIKAGAPGIGEFEARVKSVVVTPGEPWLPSPNAKQRLAVTAILSDGSTQDVTDKALFVSNDDSIAEVGDDGRITARRSGETSVMVRYMGQVAVSRVAVLPPWKRSDLSAKSFVTANYIDERVQAKLQKLRVQPSDLCTDEEFIRRATLDTCGLIPTPDEVRAFLADRRPDRRSRLIDALLERPEFVDLWTLKWNDTLRNSPQAIRNAVGEYYNWIREQVATNRPYDEFVRDLLTASGKNHAQTITQDMFPQDRPYGPFQGRQLEQLNRTPFNPATSYFAVSKDPLDATSATSQIFLGVRLECARCHNHPFEKWTQNDYYGLAAYFNGTQVRGGQLIFPAIVNYNPFASQLRHPKTNEVVEPKVLDGADVKPNPREDPRLAVTRWITAPENPWFAKAMVNRLWGYYFGRGIVEPVDDFRVTNPASNPELLDALAKDFVASKFDLKHMHRVIMNSRTYQQSSKPNAYNRSDATNFSRFYPRRLTAEAIYDSISVATGSFTPVLPPGIRFVPAPKSVMEVGPAVQRSIASTMPAGAVTRVAQLPVPRTPGRIGDFLESFGKPARQVVCECERSQEGNLTQALALMNGNEVNRKMTAPGGRLARIFFSGRPDRDVVEELYLATLSRAPTPAEQDEAAGLIKSSATRAEGVQDLMWSLLNSREFLFNH